MGSQLSGILQIAITVKDLERATAFYRDVLGIRLLMSAPNMAFFDCGGVRLYLASGEGTEHQGASSCIYFRANDISGLLGVLKENRKFSPRCLTTTSG
jgi:catechol 2,3-dioxygenase-like lactoylglutathione lyase family enzyme